jgi:hypothetical protein
MSARELCFILVAAALCMAIAKGRGRWWGRTGPARVRHDTLEAQVAADFPAHRDEAMALMEMVLAETKPENRDMVWRRVLDGSRGDIRRLRKLAAKTVESLRKIYRLFGEDVDGAPNA